MTSRPGFYIRRFGARPVVRLGFSERPESARLAHCRGFGRGSLNGTESGR
jgi:hypothetical protein